MGKLRMNGRVVPSAAAAIMDVIAAAESRFPVNDWWVGGTRVWPLIRTRLFFSASQSSYCDQVGKLTDFNGGRTLGRLAAIAFGPFRRWRAMARDSHRNAPLNESADVLCLSDGVSFSLVGGTWYERFLDPLIEYASGLGLRTRLMVPTHDYLLPRHTPSVWVQPGIDWHNLRGFAETMLVPLQVRFRDYQQFIDFVSLRRLPTHAIRVGKICADTHRILSVARYYRRHLERIRPRLACVVNYYGVEGFGFLKACRDIGIVTVDLQHGVQGELHPAYGRFYSAPTDGYDLLPDFFWCWSETEADAIRAWQKGRVVRHEPIVGGNPWLEAWRSQEASLVKQYDEKVAEMIGLTGRRRHVLVTLQFGLRDDELLAPALTLMHTAGEGWYWWVRVHPSMRDQATEVIRALRESNLGNWNVEDASSLPLYALLRHVDVHITHSSSTVLEAQVFGVHSLVGSEYGAELYQEQIQKGVAISIPFDSPKAPAVLEAQARAKLMPVSDCAYGSRARDAFTAICRKAGLELQPS